MSDKKFKLAAGDKNVLSTCVGIIVKLLEAKKKGRKCFDSFEDTFQYFQKHVTIAPEWRKRVDRGTPKWQQAIRNAAKVHRDKKTPDALTQGELMALVHGGFALPDHVPPDREVVEFPNLGGFSIPKRKKEKKPFDPLTDQTFWADRIENLMCDVDDDVRLNVVLELCDRYSVDVY